MIKVIVNMKPNGEDGKSIKVETYLNPNSISVIYRNPVTKGTAFTTPAGMMFTDEETEEFAYRVDKASMEKTFLNKLGEIGKEHG